MKQGGKETLREGFMNYNDYELLYMIKEDEEAFNYLVEKYKPLFKKASYSFFVKNKHKNIEFEDLMQNCNLTLYTAVNRYNPDKDVLFYSYLLICLKSMFKRYLRDLSTKLSNNYYVEYEESLNYNDIEFDIHNMYEEYEFETKIIEFKNTLESLESCIFELRYNDFTYKDIAILLGINKKKVDNILVKIRKKMEKYFLFS